MNLQMKINVKFQIIFFFHIKFHMKVHLEVWLGQLWAEGPPSEQHALIGSALRLGNRNSMRHSVVPPDEP